MEKLFKLMASKKLIKTDRPLELGRFFGYALLGLMNDNAYFSYIRKEDPHLIIERMNDFTEDFIRPFLP